MDNPANNVDKATVPQKLWSHQQEEVTERTIEPAWGLFFEPRLGKTRTIREQLRLLSFKRVLITAPSMALRMTWAEELKSLTATNVYDLSRGTVASRSRDILALAKSKEPSILLVNIEAVALLEAALLKYKAEAVIVDEAHLIKNVSAARTLTLFRLGRIASWRRILTGTPTPKDYVDLFAQFKFLDPEIFGTNKQKFMDRYCYTHPVWRNKIMGYKNLGELEAKMLSRTTRKKRADCFDLPQILETERRVYLTGRAEKTYKQLKKEGLIDAPDLPLVDGSHQLARLVKLQKITSGFIAEQGEDPVWLHRDKLAAVVDEITESIENGEHVVVSYYFEHEGAELESTLGQYFAGVSVQRLSGRTPHGDRERAAAPFDAAARGQDKQPRILIVQEAVGGLGISLARADLMVFASCSMNEASHSQMRDRIWEPGKATKKSYVYIRCPDTVDLFIKDILATKQSAQSRLLDIGFARAASGAV